MTKHPCDLFMTRIKAQLLNSVKRAIYG